MNIQLVNDKVVASAMLIATSAHAEQYRRDGVTPYIDHVIDVANRLNKGNNVVQAVALLHDVFEDSHYSYNDLLNAGIPIVVINMALALSHKGIESYMEYITRVAEEGVTRQIKVADILSNLSDKPTSAQVKKYAKALDILLDKELTQYTSRYESNV